MNKMGCDEDILKCLVYWTNFILALVGISLISIGIVYKISLEEFSHAIPEKYDDLTVIPVLIIPLGTSLIFLAVFGCYGSLTERIKYVILYITILLVIFVMQLTMGIITFYKLGNEATFRSQLDIATEDIFKNYNNYQNKAVADLIQHRLKCCGLNGSQYWIDQIPKSCYKTDSPDIFENPCNHQMFEYVKHCQHVMGTSITLLSLMEVIASIVSIFFVHYLKKQEKEFVFVKDYSFENGLL